MRPYSRVIELALTFTDTGEPDRAEVVWDYTDTSLFSASRGEADRLANGNTLITYSRLEEDLSSLLLEVTPEGEIVWSLRDPPNRQTYRSERVDLVFGYVRSQP